MTLTVITPPAEAPVSLDEAKDHLRIGHEAEDDHVLRLVEAASDRLETAAGLALVTRTLRRTYRQWPARLLGRGHLLRPMPVSRLTGVSLNEPDRPEEDITARFRLDGGRLSLRPWSMLPPVPADGTAAITFEAGFAGTADGVPSDLKLAVLMLVSDSYERGRTPSRRADSLPETVRDILAARREVRL
ncbi:MAG: hypothetical protein GVY09_16130 [Gammaproteobacteria bacterium]|jgi:uncharacterized phiE125 gp8 family phage protein|nr:hypothetical protein [Gammaproteobacteria bacterium]